MTELVCGGAGLYWMLIATGGAVPHYQCRGSKAAAAAAVSTDDHPA